MLLNENTVADLILLLIFNLGLIFALRFVAPHINLIDHRGERKLHSHPTPLVGGLAIYLTLLTAVAINNDWDTNVGMITCWAGAIVFIGCIDDIKNINWPIRLCVQVIAALGVILTTGIKVTYLGTYPIIGQVELDHLTVAFTVFAVVSLTNAFNLIDGIDGLCGSLLFLPALALMGLIYWLSGKIDFYFFIILASLAIFLSFNLSQNPKHKIFLGDAGSTGLGFILGFLVISLIKNNHTEFYPPLALWLFLVPIFDTVFVIISRLLERKSIFEPSSKHIHHIFALFFNSKTKALIILVVLALVFIVIGIAFNQLNDFTSLIVLIFVSFAMKFALNVFKMKFDKNKELTK